MSEVDVNLTIVELNRTAEMNGHLGRKSQAPSDLKPMRRAEDRLPKVDISDVEKMSPPLFARWIKDVSARICVGPEFAAAPLFSVLGGIVGRRVAVRPRQFDSWKVYPCCLWSCISAPPGSRKSPVLGEARKFADLLDDAAAEAYSVVRKQAESRLKILSQRQRHLEKQVQSAIEQDAHFELTQLEDSLTALAKEIEAVTPKQKRFLTSDSTSAKLIEIMADNPGGIIVFRDELAGLIQTFEQMGNESLRDFYLEAWDGKGRNTQDRVGAGTRRAKAVAATLLGSTQPDRLAQIVSQSNDGLIQRFGLLVCMPERDHVETDQEPDTAAFEKIYQFCQRVSELNGESPLEISLSPDSRRLFLAWQKEVSSLMRDPSTSPALKSHLAKYPSLFCGLACIFQLSLTFEAKGTFEDTSEVCLEASEMAAEWIDSIFLPHAKFVYEKNVAQSAADKLALRIQSNQVFDGMGVNALVRKHWEGLGTVALVRYALGELEDLGWLRIERISAGGRPKEIIRLHASLSSKVSNA